MNASIDFTKWFLTKHQSSGIFVDNKDFEFVIAQLGQPAWDEFLSSFSSNKSEITPITTQKNNDIIVKPVKKIPLNKGKKLRVDAQTSTDELHVTTVKNSECALRSSSEGVRTNSGERCSQEFETNHIDQLIDKLVVKNPVEKKKRVTKPKKITEPIQNVIQEPIQELSVQEEVPVVAKKITKKRITKKTDVQEPVQEPVQEEVPVQELVQEEVPVVAKKITKKRITKKTDVQEPVKELVQEEVPNQELVQEKVPDIEVPVVAKKITKKRIIKKTDVQEQPIQEQPVQEVPVQEVPLQNVIQDDVQVVAKKITKKRITKKMDMQEPIVDQVINNQVIVDQVTDELVEEIPIITNKIKNKTNKNIAINDIITPNDEINILNKQPITTLDDDDDTHISLTEKFIEDVLFYTDSHDNWFDQHLNPINAIKHQ